MVIIKVLMHPVILDAMNSVRHAVQQEVIIVCPVKMDFSYQGHNA